jgi:hypothetical protein
VEQECLGPGIQVADVAAVANDGMRNARTTVAGTVWSICCHLWYGMSMSVVAAGRCRCCQRPTCFRHLRRRRKTGSLRSCTPYHHTAGGDAWFLAQVSWADWCSTNAGIVDRPFNGCRLSNRAMECQLVTVDSGAKLLLIRFTSNAVVDPVQR